MFALLCRHVSRLTIYRYELSPPISTASAVSGSSTWSTCPLVAPFGLHFGPRALSGQTMARSISSRLSTSCRRTKWPFIRPLAAYTLRLPTRRAGTRTWIVGLGLDAPSAKPLQIATEQDSPLQVEVSGLHSLTRPGSCEDLVPWLLSPLC